MEYDELIEALKSMLPKKVLYGDLIGAEGVYAHSGPMVYEDPEPYFIEQAITAITDLISRAEAAEAAQETLQKAMDEYKDRAEKAERERNAAVSDISKILGEIDEIREEIGPEDIYDALSVVCRGYCSQSGNMCYAVENGYECKNFKWRGQKEE